MRPLSYLGTFFLPLVACFFLVAFLYPPLEAIFWANGRLNGLILGLACLCVPYTLFLVLSLSREERWVERLAQTPARVASGYGPKGPLTEVMEFLALSVPFSTHQVSFLVKNVEAHLAARREWLRYLSGVLIALGLLGTFWGLSETVLTIASGFERLAVTPADMDAFMDALRRQMTTPLSGLGTAFSTSLFGIGGSFLVGFFLMQVSRAHGQFVARLRAVLLHAVPTQGLQSHAAPSFWEGIMGNLVQHTENLHHALARLEQGNQKVQEAVLGLTQTQSKLADFTKMEQTLLLKLAESQIDLQNTLGSLSDLLRHAVVDSPAHTHLRNIDVLCSDILKDMAHTRQELVETLRQEWRLLLKVLSTKGMSEP